MMVNMVFSFGTIIALYN
ncbi:Protein of unknown function [Bacillus mycoides]|nr:Protein of unknown function [Bacillus mycoides]